MHTVGSLTFPGSPLAPDKDQLHSIAGFWPDIEKSRAEARRLLKEAGAEGLSFELLNRNVDQPYGPSHYSNQDLGTIWLSPPECGRCGDHPTMEHAALETGK